MRYILTALMGFFLHCYLQGQDSFNRLIDYGYPVNHFRHILVHGDTIVALGVAYPDSFNLQQGLLLVQLDSNGQLLNQRLMLDSAGRDLTILVGGRGGDCLARTPDGGYAITAAPLQTDEAIVFKLRPDLSTEYHLEFWDSTLVSNFKYMVLPLSDGYVLYGSLQDASLDVYGFLRYVGLDGAVFWERLFDFTPGSNQISDVKILTDSTLLVCDSGGADPNTFVGYSNLYIIDLATGATLKMATTQNAAQDLVLTHAMPLSDGGIITYGQELVGPHIPIPPVGTNFTKYNQNLEPVWTKRWGRVSRATSRIWMFRSYENQQQQIVSIGRSINDDVAISRRGWVFKYSLTGDSIWEREIPLPGASDSFLVLRDLYGGGLLSSGSIIAGGMAQLPEGYRAWLVKLTPDGCVDSLFTCSPYVPPSSTTGAAVSSAALSVYPNPANRVAHLRFPPVQTPAQLRVYHLTGQEIQHRTVWMGDGMADLWVGDYPPGVYVVVLEQRDGQRWTGRLVVQRG